MNDVPEPLRLADFDFDLPESCIAQEPVEPRDASRLLRLGPGGTLTHRRFRDLVDEFERGDVLVVNESRVLPARLRLKKPTGGAVEVLFHRPETGTIEHARSWRGIARPAKSMKAEARFYCDDRTELRCLRREGREVTLAADEPISQIMNRCGEVPLPPYIRREHGPTDADRSSYQTVFATRAGSVAAPTASLHFTEELLAALEARGVLIVRVVLHVGLGTFLPIDPEHAQDLTGHRMHAEWYEVPRETQDALARAKEAGKRIVCVGTTSVRAIESFAASGKSSGETRLFIYPGFEFRSVDALITNFHLPGSTLLLLVAAFVGRERLLDAYRVAIAEGYRFYSYGDAMFLQRGQS